MMTPHWRRGNSHPVHEQGKVIWVYLAHGASRLSTAFFKTMLHGRDIDQLKSSLEKEKIPYEFVYRKTFIAGNTSTGIKYYDKNIVYLQFLTLLPFALLFFEKGSRCFSSTILELGTLPFCLAVGNHHLCQSPTFFLYFPSIMYVKEKFS